MNPLWLISLFFSFTETILGYAAFKTSGPVQLTLVAFVVAFPTLVASAFFLLLWYKPHHLYAPSDYQTDRSFLDGLSPKSRGAERLSDDIERTIVSKLTSHEVSDRLRHGDVNPENILRETAHEIVESIQRESFIQVDISAFVRDTKPLRFAHNTFRSVSDFTNEVYYALTKKSDVRIYSYGTDWILEDVRTRKRLQTARMIAKVEVGTPMTDHRTLDEVGVVAGTHLKAIRP